MRPAPKLIDPNLLYIVNEVFVAISQQSNSILVWIYDTIGYYVKQNVLFSVVLFGLIGFLLYRYIENIKKKNKIIKNLNSDKPIEIKLEKPIDYNNKPNPKSNQNGGDVLSEISIKQEFDKDIENDLKLINDPNQTKISQNPQQPQQQQQQQPQQQQQQQEIPDNLNPNLDRMPTIDSKIDPNQQQYRSTNPNQPSNVIAIQEDNMNEEVNYQTTVLQKSNIPVVEEKCGIARQVQEAQQPKCGFQGKKNAYLETSEKSKNSEKSNKKRDKKKSKRKDRKKSKKEKKREKKEKKKQKKEKKRKRTPKLDRHELEILNIFEREMAITHGSIDKERSNKQSKFKPQNIEHYEGPMALNTFSDNYMNF